MLARFRRPKATVLTNNHFGRAGVQEIEPHFFYKGRQIIHHAILTYTEYCVYIRQNEKKHYNFRKQN